MICRFHSVLRLAVLSAIATLGIANTALRADADDFDAKVRAYLLANPEVILEAMDILARREAAAALAQKLALFPDLFSAPARHGLGDPDAPVRVIEFFDYKCAPCKAMHPKLAQLTQEHPDLRIEMRHLPILAPGSERAARFALATRMVSGDAAYAVVHERLWHLRGPLRAEVFARISEEEGLDFAAIESAMQSDSITARIDQNREIAIALGIFGTPAFVTPRSVRFGQSEPADLAADWFGR